MGPRLFDANLIQINVLKLEIVKLISNASGMCPFPHRIGSKLEGVLLLRPFLFLAEYKTHRALYARSFRRKCLATRIVGVSGCDRVARKWEFPTLLQKHTFAQARIRTFFGGRV